MRRPSTVRGRTTAVAALVVAAALAVAAVGLIGLLQSRLVAAERTAAALRAADVAALADSGDLPSRLSFPGEDEGLSAADLTSGHQLGSLREAPPTTTNLRAEGSALICRIPSLDWRPARHARRYRMSPAGGDLGSGEHLLAHPDEPVATAAASGSTVSTCVR